MKENLEMFNNKILSTWVISSRAPFVSKRSKEEKQSRKLPINVMFLTYVRVVYRYYLKLHYNCLHDNEILSYKEKGCIRNIRGSKYQLIIEKPF